MKTCNYPPLYATSVALSKCLPNVGFSLSSAIKLDTKWDEAKVLQQY